MRGPATRRWRQTETGAPARGFHRRPPRQRTRAAAATTTIRTVRAVAASTPSPILGSSSVGPAARRSVCVTDSPPGAHGPRCDRRLIRSGDRARRPLARTGSRRRHDRAVPPQFVLPLRPAFVRRTRLALAPARRCRSPPAFWVRMANAAMSQASCSPAPRCRRRRFARGAVEGAARARRRRSLCAARGPFCDPSMHLHAHLVVVQLIREAAAHADQKSAAWLTSPTGLP